MISHQSINIKRSWLKLVLIWICYDQGSILCEKAQFFISKNLRMLLSAFLCRYHTAVKAKESSNAKDYAAAEAKAEQLKTQYEDEMMKFEAAKVCQLSFYEFFVSKDNYTYQKCPSNSCQDLVITEMLTLVSKEQDYAEHIKKVNALILHILF